MLSALIKVAQLIAQLFHMRNTLQGDGRPAYVPDRDSPREAQRRDARLPRSRTLLQIMPHCRKRSSSMRPEGRGGNGSGSGSGDTRRNVDTKHDFVAKDDEDHSETGS